jgi:hypothetical protein
MSEHLSPEQQILLLNRALAERPLLHCLQHLASCVLCREQVSQRRGQLMDMTNEFTELPTHLAYEQLSAYLLGTLDEVTREIMHNHLATCEFCAGEMQALTGLQTELHELLRQTTPRAAKPAQPWWVTFKKDWLAQLKHRSWPGPALTLATTSVFLLVSLSGWWWRANHAPVEPTQPALQSVKSPLPAPTFATASLKQAPAQAAQALPAPTQSAHPDLLALLDHGEPISLRPDGSLQTRLALTATNEATLKRTLAGQPLRLPEQLAQLAPPPNTLKSATPAPEIFHVLTPLGQILQSTRPVFRWQALPGASSYELAVFDEDFNQVLSSGPVTQTTWQAVKPLPRGRIYLWQVTAQVGNQQITAPLAPAPEARFQVLSQTKMQELQQARQTVGQSHLLLGVLYAQAGLLEAAERELRALQRENPQAPLVSQWLRQLHQARTPKP